MSTKKSTPRFIASVYRVTIKPGSSSAELQVEGQKLGVPNQRIVIDQKSFKISGAKVVYRQKNKEIEHNVTRINYLPSLQQVRLHTASPLYPGRYEINFTFTPVDTERLRSLVDHDISNVTLREILPSFDNLESRTGARIEIIN